MIRLQPQAERLQKDIEELRQELEQRELESQEEINRLHQASSLIDELHEQVLHAEKEQDLLTVERRETEEEAAECQKQEVTAAKDFKVLKDELSSVQEEHRGLLHDLAEAEMESHRCWEQLEDATEQSSDLCQRLRMMSSNLEDLTQKSEESHEARVRLRGHWHEAVQLAAVERGQVEAVTVQMGQLRGHGAVAELQASKLCDEAVHSEVVSSELWQDLAKVEGQDHRRDQLASELRCAQAEHEELRAYIWMQEEYDSELLASLNESEAQKASVSEALQVDALRWEELKSSIRETQDMASRLYAELSEHTKCHSSVKARHSQVEEAGQGRLADLRGQHKEHATEAASLEAKANQLQAESQQLDGDIRKTRQLKEELVQTLATREDEHQAELVRKAELNTELEELKKKWRCAIS